MKYDYADIKRGCFNVNVTKYIWDKKKKIIIIMSFIIQ